MDCMEVQEKLPLYHDRDLDEALLNGVDEHLKTCDQCRKEYSGLTSAWDVMDVWEDTVPPDRLRKRILGSMPRKGRAAWSRVALPMAAGFLMVIGVALYYAGFEAGKTGEMTERAAVQQSDKHANINEDEIVANLEILEEEEFYDALDEMVKIDYLPLMDEPEGGEQGRERSSLDMVLA